MLLTFFFFSSRRRHTRLQGDWSSDVCSSDLGTRQTASRSSGGRCGRIARRGAGHLLEKWAKKRATTLAKKPCAPGCGEYASSRPREPCSVRRANRTARRQKWLTP